jgi:hypothetical protein
MTIAAGTKLGAYEIVAMVGSLSIPPDALSVQATAPNISIGVTAR